MRRFLACTTSVLVLVACGSEPKPVRTPAVVATASVSAKPKPAPVEAAPAPVVEESAPLPPCEPIVTTLPEVMHKDFDVPIPDMVDGDRLAVFYTKLARVVRGKATDHVRIGVWGDSNMTMDWVTGEMRRKLQGVLGDGGHGYVALGRPWPWYHHMDVKHDFFKESWLTFAISTKPARDKLINFGGIAVQSLGPGATTWFGTSEDKKSPIGLTASEIELYFLKRPGGGAFKLFVDGVLREEIDTDAPDPTAGFYAMSLEDAPHKIKIVSSSVKPVRLFGATLERKTPSVIIDSLGVGASSIEHLAEREDPALLEATVAHRKYDLVIDLTGTWTFDFKRAPTWINKVIDVYRKARPDLGVLLLSPADFGIGIQRVVQVGTQKKELAHEKDYAFFDYQGAMGGKGSMKRFEKKKMAAEDLMHLSDLGGAYMGDRVVYAIWKDFMRWLEAHPDAGCAAPIAASE